MLDSGSGDDPPEGREGQRPELIGGSAATPSAAVAPATTRSTLAAARATAPRGGAGDDVIHLGNGPRRRASAATAPTPCTRTPAPTRSTPRDGDDTVYVNNGTAVESVDCGPGADTIYVTTAGRAASRTPRRLRGGDIRDCEYGDRGRGADGRPHQGRHTRWRTPVSGETLRGDRAQRQPPRRPRPGQGLRRGRRGRHLGQPAPGRPEPAASTSSTAVPTPTSSTAAAGRNLIHGDDGDDFLQGGPLHNTNPRRRRRQPLASASPARGNNTARPATATTRSTRSARKPRVTIDCGPGFDRVNIGFNRLRQDPSTARLVKKLYKKR